MKKKDFNPLAMMKAIRDDSTLRSSGELAFLTVCVLRTDNKTCKVRASLEMLANDAKMSERHVTRLIKSPSVAKYFAKIEGQTRAKNLWFHTTPDLIPDMMSGKDGSIPDMMSGKDGKDEPIRDMMSIKDGDDSGHIDINSGHIDTDSGHIDINSGHDVTPSTYTSTHTSTSTSTIQDGDGNRGCDGNELTGTQTASQQPEDSTKEDAHSPDSSEATTRAAAAPTSQEATREETEPKDNATASLDLKTNAAGLDSKTSSAERDSKTSSADSEPDSPTWQEMVDKKAQELEQKRLTHCPVCNVPFRKTDEEKWCPNPDCIRRYDDAKEGRKVARKYEINELVEPKTSAEADQLVKTKEKDSEEWIPWLKQS